MQSVWLCVASYGFKTKKILGITNPLSLVLAHNNALYFITKESLATLLPTPMQDMESSGTTPGASLVGAALHL